MTANPTCEEKEITVAYLESFIGKKCRFGDLSPLTAEVWGTLAAVLDHETYRFTNGDNCVNYRYIWPDGMTVGEAHDLGKFVNAQDDYGIGRPDSSHSLTIGFLPYPPAMPIGADGKDYLLKTSFGLVSARMGVRGNWSYFGGMLELSENDIVGYVPMEGY